MRAAVRAACTAGFTFAAPVRIGTPLPNLYCVIMDESMTPVPTGAVGELCIGGLGVARGDLRRAEPTVAACGNPMNEPLLFHS